MRKLEFLGTVKDGHVLPDDPGAVKVWLGDRAGKRVTVSVKLGSRRSLPQNSWYHAGILPAVARLLTRSRDVPISTDQAHYILKASFLGTVETPLGLVPKSTRELTTAEFSDYCERIRAHFASEGHFIPGPNEQAA